MRRSDILFAMDRFRGLCRLAGCSAFRHDRARATENRVQRALRRSTRRGIFRFWRARIVNVWTIRALGAASRLVALHRTCARDGLAKTFERCWYDWFECNAVVGDAENARCCRGVFFVHRVGVECELKLIVLGFGPAGLVIDDHGIPMRVVSKKVDISAEGDAVDRDVEFAFSRDWRERGKRIARGDDGCASFLASGVARDPVFGFEGGPETRRRYPQICLVAPSDDGSPVTVGGACWRKVGSRPRDRGGYQ